MSQLPLEPAAEPPAQRVRTLAGVLAGFQWPGRGSFEKLKKPQQRTALRVARQALAELQAADEGDP